LEKFAEKHKNEIKKDVAFRKQFQEMCAAVGVDPLACIHTPHSLSNP
jgi:ESCRT-II complex subunit VPS22